MDFFLLGGGRFQREGEKQRQEDFKPRVFRICFSEKTEGGQDRKLTITAIEEKQYRTSNV